MVGKLEENMDVSVEGFLTHNVDGYLFGDIENLRSMRPLPDMEYGAAAYPMLQAVLSGIELLGMLVYPKPLNWDPTPDCRPKQHHFSCYWYEVLCRRDKVYKPFHDAARSLMRNPLDHAFQTTGNVVVTKGPLHPRMPPFALMSVTGPVVID